MAVGGGVTVGWGVAVESTVAVGVKVEVGVGTAVSAWQPTKISKNRQTPKTLFILGDLCGKILNIRAKA